MNLGVRTALWSGGGILIPKVGLLLNNNLDDLSGNFKFSISQGSLAYVDDSPIAGQNALETTGFLATAVGDYGVLPTTGDYSYASFTKMHEGIAESTAWSYFGYGLATADNCNNLKHCNRQNRYTVQNYWFGNDSEYHVDMYLPELKFTDWHSYVWVYSGGTHRLYIDGVFRFSRKITRTPSFAQTNLCVGRSSYTVDYMWNGLLSNIALYDVALKEKQISQFAAGGINCVKV